MKVRYLKDRNNKALFNQLVIYHKGVVWFQSYEKIIVRIKEGRVTLDSKYWNDSATTNRYKNLFLGEGKEVTEAKIKSGEYAVGNLNRDA